MSNYLLKHAKLFKRYSIISFKRSIEHRVSFYFNVLNQIINVLIWMMFWTIILSQVGEYKGWTFAMTTLLLGFFFMQDSVWILFWRNWNYSEDIINGNITSYLVKPMNTYLALIWKYMDISRLGDMFIGVGLIFGALWYFSFEVTIIKLALAMTICLIGALITLNLFALSNVFCFWWGNIYFLRNMLSGFFQLEKTPLNVLPFTAKMIYTFLFPLIFIATYPVLVVSEFSLVEGLEILALELVIAFTGYLLLFILWKRGIKRFEAYGG